MIVVEVRVPHVERPEDVFLGELAQRLAARPLDDHGQQKVSGVAVEVLGSGWKVQRLLPRDDPQRFVVTGDAIEVHAGDRHERQVVADAAGVISR